MIGDRLDSIASGPTAPDETTYGDALDVLERHRLTGRIPDSIVRTLERGLRGEVPETPKPGAPLFGRVENVIVGSNRLALEAAQEKAREMGYEAVVLTSELRGEAREAARLLAGRPGRPRSGRNRRRPALCLISGGRPP